MWKTHDKYGLDTPSLSRTGADHYKKSQKGVKWGKGRQTVVLKSGGVKGASKKKKSLADKWLFSARREITVETIKKQSCPTRGGGVRIEPACSSNASATTHVELVGRNHSSQEGTRGYTAGKGHSGILQKICLTLFGVPIGWLNGR